MRRMKFSLATIAYVFALLAAGMAAAGTWGLLATVVIVWFWHHVGRSGKRWGWAGLIVAPLVLTLATAWLARTVDDGYQAIQRQLCISNIKQLGYVLQQYESVHKAFPPAATRDKNGAVLHSWRTMMLPYLNEESLFKSIDLKKAWSDRGNLATLLKSRPLIFACPLHDHSESATSYFAVTGEQTAWPPGRGRRWDEITDGASNTILLLEIPHKHVMWGEPADVTLEVAVEFLSTPPKEPWAGHRGNRGFFFKPSYGVLVEYVDGHTGYLNLPMSREAATAALTANGGEEISEEEMYQLPPAELDYSRCYAFAAFAGLTLLPWVRLVRRAGRREGSPAAR